MSLCANFLETPFLKKQFPQTLSERLSIGQPAAGSFTVRDLQYFEFMQFSVSLAARRRLTY